MVLINYTIIVMVFLPYWMWISTDDANHNDTNESKFKKQMPMYSHGNSKLPNQKKQFSVVRTKNVRAIVDRTCVLLNIWDTEKKESVCLNWQKPYILLYIDNALHCLQSCRPTFSFVLFALCSGLLFVFLFSSQFSIDSKTVRHIPQRYYIIHKIISTHNFYLG